MGYLSGILLLSITIVVSSIPDVAAGEFDVAVVIGNKNYEDNAMPSVDYAINDAENITQYLNELMDIPKRNIIKLADATSGDFIKTFGNNDDYKGLLWQKADPLGRSKIYIYFSGHGYPSHDGGLLLPSDTSHNAAALVGYSLNTLMGNVGKISALKSVIILDSCFSGLTQGSSLISAASPIYSLEISNELPANMTLITAAGNNEIASWNVEEKQGLFTYHLLRGLYGRGDFDSNGKVDVAEIKRYLDTSMTYDARRLYARSQYAFVSGEENLVLGAITNLQTPNNLEKSPVMLSEKLEEEGYTNVPFVIDGSGQISVVYRYAPPPPMSPMFQLKPPPRKNRKARHHKKPRPKF